MCEEKNDHSRTIKRNHLNQGNTKLLSDIIVKELLEVFNGRNIDNLSKQSVLLYVILMNHLTLRVQRKNVSKVITH